MFVVGRLTYKCVMSSVIILLCSLTWILCSSCATSYEFFVVYVFGKSIKLRSFLLRNLASLYDSACVLFITGRMGSPSLCVFMCALSLGGVGFICIKYLCLPFSSVNGWHCWRACWICFWRESVGSLFRQVMWYSCINIFTFSSNESMLFITIALFLSALTIVRLFLFKISLIWLRLCWCLLCKIKCVLDAIICFIVVAAICQNVPVFWDPVV